MMHVVSTGWRLREHEARTNSAKFVTPRDNFYSGLKPFCIFRAAGQEPSSDKVVHLFIVSCEICNMGCRMDRWMGFIVLLALTRFGESALLEAAVLESFRMGDPV